MFWKGFNAGAIGTLIGTLVFHALTAMVVILAVMITNRVGPNLYINVMKILAIIFTLVQIGYWYCYKPFVFFKELKWMTIFGSGLSAVIFYYIVAEWQLVQELSMTIELPGRILLSILAPIIAVGCISGLFSMYRNIRS